MLESSHLSEKKVSDDHCSMNSLIKSCNTWYGDPYWDRVSVIREKSLLLRIPHHNSN